MATRYGPAPIPAYVRFERHVKPEGGCLIWQGGTMRTGYGVFDGRSAHRFAWRTWMGDIPAGLYVCHRCDNRLCVRISHLFLGTHQENMADGVRKGRFASGPRHGVHTRPEAHPRGHDGRFVRYGKDE